ncbi:MAG: ribosomal protein S18-alanine N-acetyltransferase [Ruminococcus sp.]|nr:ribosomal protein S18-alanine N-acetyltransferase [Ruminococcus sp.]
MSVRIRPMVLADCEAVAAIEKECFSQPWSRQEFENQLTLSIARTYVCDEDGLVIGFINVWVVEGEINLNNIALTEKSRGRGLGRALIEYMENNEQAERCNLEVRVSNERAIGLYRSLGFEEVGLRKGFYSEPTEDALLMTKRYGET